MKSEDQMSIAGVFSVGLVESSVLWYFTSLSSVIGTFYHFRDQGEIYRSNIEN